MDGRQVVRFLRNRSEPRRAVEYGAEVGHDTCFGPSLSAEDCDEFSQNLDAQDQVEFISQRQINDAGWRALLSMRERIRDEDAGVDNGDGAHPTRRACAR